MCASVIKTKTRSEGGREGPRSLSSLNGSLARGE